MAPEIAGMTMDWSEDFIGDEGTGPNQSTWNIITRPQSENANNELQNYTNDTQTAYISGDGLCIVPRRDSSGTWTSARLECTRSFACEAGQMMLLQAEIRVGYRGNDTQNQGLWPAFWTLGQNFREGVSWPKCAEWDILETTIKLGDRNQGTLHFARPNGDHDGGFNGQTQYSRGDFNTWALRVDRTPGGWEDQTLIWYHNDSRFFEVTGAQIGSAELWEEVACKPFFPILNVAVGGDYPGNPDENTLDGLDSGMQVRYVAVYRFQ